MIRRLKAIAQALVAGVLLLCIMCGILLMMCECEDAHRQTATLIGGFCLFLCGAIPCILLAGTGGKRNERM